MKNMLASQGNSKVKRIDNNIKIRIKITALKLKLIQLPKENVINE